MALRLARDSQKCTNQICTRTHCEGNCMLVGSLFQWVYAVASIIYLYKATEAVWPKLLWTVFSFCQVMYYQSGGTQCSLDLLYQWGLRLPRKGCLSKEIELPGGAKFSSYSDHSMVHFFSPARCEAFRLKVWAQILTAWSQRLGRWHAMATACWFFALPRPGNAWGRVLKINSLDLHLVQKKVYLFISARFGFFCSVQGVQKKTLGMFCTNEGLGYEESP